MFMLLPERYSGDAFVFLNCLLKWLSSEKSSSNPDLVARIKHNASLAAWDEETFYQGGEKGYIDYPKLF